jgi:hypothetical protein
MTTDAARTDGKPAAAPPSKLPRRPFFNDMPDKGLFAFVSVLGFGFILWGKNASLNPSLMTALAVSVMFVYGAVAFSMSAVQQRLDRLGDNFYYLGFIFTLASLSSTLLALDRGAGVQELLGNFGLALATTIVGIAGRVIFAQMRGDLDAVEEQARRDLAQTSADLKMSLANSLRDFESFNTGVKQAAKEILEKDIVRAGEKLKALEERYVNAVTGIADKLDANTKQLEGVRESLVALNLKIDVVFSKPEERAVRELIDASARLAGIQEILADRFKRRSIIGSLWNRVLWGRRTRG